MKGTAVGRVIKHFGEKSCVLATEAIIWILDLPKLAAAFAGSPNHVKGRSTLLGPCTKTKPSRACH